MHHYNSVVSLQIIICNDDDGEHIYGATLQSCSGACMGVANNYTCYHQLYRLAPVLFTPVPAAILSPYFAVHNVAMLCKVTGH